jgi:hypothetical protein
MNLRDSGKAASGITPAALREGHKLKSRMIYKPPRLGLYPYKKVRGLD